MPHVVMCSCCNGHEGTRNLGWDSDLCCEENKRHHIPSTTQHDCAAPLLTTDKAQLHSFCLHHKALLEGHNGLGLFEIPSAPHPTPRGRYSSL